ncbi:TolC family protein [Methylomonas sp. MgM2]
MKHTRHFSLTISLVGLLGAGCSGLNTDLSIPEKPMPANFQEDQKTQGGASIKNVDWREYFADSRLIKLIDTAVTNNLDLQIALQRIEMSRSSIKLANFDMLPQVELQLGGGVHKFGLYTMDGAGNDTTQLPTGETVPEILPDMFIGAHSSWEIDVWGKLKNQRQSAVSSYLSSIEATNFVISNLVSDIAVHYNELLALDHELDIIRQTIKKVQEALDVIKLQKEAGRANELAVQQFSAELFSIQVSEKRVLQKITITENTINYLLGRYPQPIERSKEIFFTEKPHELSTGVPSELLENRPDIRAAEHDIQASKYDLQAAKKSFYPSVKISAALGYRAFDPEFLFTTPASVAFSVFGQLIQPIVNMKALEARFNTAQANQLTAMYNYQKAILNAYVEVANLLSNISKLQDIKSSKKQESDALQQAVDISRELYKSGKATYLEVLIAQQSALQSNLELINVIKQERIAQINLYKSLGGGWR